MGLFKKKCAYCRKTIPKNEEIFSEIKLPEFVDPRIKAFCSEEHLGQYISIKKGTPSKKPYCLNCDD